MEDLNNVPSSGTYGAAINEVNTNFSLVVNAINSLEYATTHSKGIYNNGFTPNTTTLPNSVDGDWCMVLGTGNTFPARIWTFNGTTWAQGGQWNPDGIDLTGYATTSALNTAVANSLAQATARMGYGEATASNNAYSVNITNYTLPAKGGVVRVKMPTAATGAATLNITETGAKTIWYNGLAVTSENTWGTGEVISVYYDGTKYMASNSQGGNIEKIFGDTTEGDFSISDEVGNEIVRFQEGHILTKNFDSSKAISSESATPDLAISDDNNWDIVQFKNGHIKTKNFDSSLFINTTKKFIGKKFAILGDSISTFQGWLPSDIAGYDGATYATYYKPSGSGNVNSVTKTWWYQMLELLGLTPSFDVVNNCAWSGSKVTGDASSTTSASAGCSDRRISDLSIRGYVPDIIIVFISCNDWGGNVSVGTWDVNTALPNDASTFRSAYAMMLNKINIAYPKARIFCCTNLDDVARDRVAGYPPNNTGGVTTYSWNQNIIEIAEAFGCDIINMHDCGIKYSNITSLVVDSGLHPNMEGMTMMAQKAASELIAKY